VTKEPIDEFLENDKLFLGAFPDLFFLQIKIPKIGSLSNSFTQELLRQSDNRFSQVDELIFSLFNQSQRHASARQVATRVRSDTKSVVLFIHIIEAPNFMEDLKSAISAPDSKQSRALMSHIMPLIRVGGTSIAFGPVQRSMAVSKLCSMIQFVGLLAWFITVSPSDLNSTIILRLASPLNNNEDPTQCKFFVPLLNVHLETL